MLKRLHAIAGAVALLTVLSFWGATVLAEFILDRAAVVAVKGAIVNGLFVLVPAMIVTGMTGAMLSRGRSGGLVAAKTRRMRVLAMNGVLVMIPAAVFLSAKADAGEMDGLFYLVQAAELAVGALQMAFMARNARDGGRLTALRRA